jgi:hypothetical protein
VELLKSQHLTASCCFCDSDSRLQGHRLSDDLMHSEYANESSRCEVPISSQEKADLWTKPFLVAKAVLATMKENQ